jgi:leucyl aminopeptidase
LRGALKRAAKEIDFTGKVKQRLVLDTFGKLAARRVALVGLGDMDQVDATSMLYLGGATTRLGNRVSAKSVVLLAPPTHLDNHHVAELLSRGAELGAYRYDRYQSEKGRKLTVSALQIGFDGGQPSKGRLSAVARGQVVARAVAVARDLVNEPASDLYPESFARRAVALGRKAGLRTRVLGPKELEKRGMRLILGVGQGSARPPRLVHLTYEPPKKRKNARPTVLVGKGITFDSGGLSLKPNSAMLDMKVDMAGAAAVVGAMLAVAEIKPTHPVHGVLALAENMPSGTAIRLGDVIKSAAGKTVEITNTDAEGRLVLADAIHYAKKLEPERIIDLATLTGACVVALGEPTVGLFTNNSELSVELLDSAEAAGESFWRLPLTADLREGLRSDVADMKNTGGRWGGAITAALFLKEFVGDTAWAHLDIAGPATTTKDDGIFTKGGTGVAVATLANLLL